MGLGSGLVFGVGGEVGFYAVYAAIYAIFVFVSVFWELLFGTI